LIIVWILFWGGVGYWLGLTGLGMLTIGWGCLAWGCLLLVGVMGLGMSLSCGWNTIAVVID